MRISAPSSAGRGGMARESAVARFFLASSCCFFLSTKVMKSYSAALEPLMKLRKTFVCASLRILMSMFKTWAFPLICAVPLPKTVP